MKYYDEMFIAYKLLHSITFILFSFNVYFEMLHLTTEIRCNVSSKNDPFCAICVYMYKYTKAYDCLKYGFNTNSLFSDKLRLSISVHAGERIQSSDKKRNRNEESQRQRQRQHNEQNHWEMQAKYVHYTKR